MLNVFTYNSQGDLAIEENLVKEAVASLLRFESISCQEVHIHFVSKQEITNLHEKYFNDPTPTDCITFPIDELKNGQCDILGEVFICPKTAINYASVHKLDVQEELSLYLVHGILHLLGYDDIDDSDRAIMKEKEMQCINHLKSQNLIFKNPQFAIGKA